MPLYEYECTVCRKHTEKIQKFSDPEITACPHCGGELKRVISAPAFALKGGGWYADGYGSPKAANSGAEGSSAGSDGAKDGGAKDAGTKSGSGDAAAPAAATPAASTASAPSSPAPSAAPASSEKK